MVVGLQGIGLAHAGLACFRRSASLLQASLNVCACRHRLGVATDMRREGLDLEFEDLESLSSAECMRMISAGAEFLVRTAREGSPMWSKGLSKFRFQNEKSRCDQSI